MTTNHQLNYKLRNVKNFIGVFACDAIPEIKHVPAYMIVNTDPSGQPGEHWVAIHVNKTAEYFDSYGLEPLNSEIVDFLTDYEYEYNVHLLQAPTSMTCGEYCVLYVYLKSIGYSLCNIIQLFTTHASVNDKIISEIYKRL